VQVVMDEVEVGEEAPQYQVVVSPAPTPGDAAVTLSWEDMAAALDESAAYLARATSSSSHLTRPTMELSAWEGPGTAGCPSPSHPAPTTGAGRRWAAATGGAVAPHSATACGAGGGGGGEEGAGGTGSGWEGDGVMWWDVAPTPAAWRRPGFKAQVAALLGKCEWRMGRWGGREGRGKDDAVR
jgi:hypothetical protein